MGKQWKQWLTLLFWTPKSLQMLTAAMKLKRYLLLGRKMMTNLDSILKIREITLPTKVYLVKAMVFPVATYGCESWSVKKAECSIDDFEPWCWRRLLRVPWTARRSNQSILKEISPGCSLKWLKLKLKRKYFGHLLWSWLIGKDPDAGKDWGQEERWDGWMASPTQWTWVWVNSKSWWWTGRPGVLRFIGPQRLGQDWVTELNGKTKKYEIMIIKILAIKKEQWFLKEKKKWIEPYFDSTYSLYKIFKRSWG